MRTSDARAAAAALALLAGCRAADQPSDARAQAADDDARVPCATGAAALAPECAVDRAQTDRGLVLTLRRPDGGFRRLLVTRDGRGVVAADGAARARVTVVDAGTIEVALAGERYRLPATVKP